MTRTVTSWRDILTSSWHSSTSQELLARITWFLSWILCFRGQGFRKKWSRQCDVYRDVMMGWDVELCHDDVTMSRHDVTVHITLTALLFSLSWHIVQHLRNYLPEFDGFSFESYVFEVKDFENNKAVIVTCTVTSWRDEMLNYVMMTSRCSVMTSR